MNAINVLLALMIVVSFLLAIALHEFAHAVMASWLGDSTPRAEGRQTLRILPHIDPVGTMMCAILAFQPIAALPIGLGWGKPVQPDTWRMKVNNNVGLVLVAIAGPLFNLIIGLLVALLLHFVAGPLASLSNIFTERLIQFLVVFAMINIALVFFNLIPLYPLDGYQVVYALLPSRYAVRFARSAPYGQFAILALFFILPFLAQLARAGDFPLFQLPYYIWLGSASIVSLLTDPLAGIRAIQAIWIW